MSGKKWTDDEIQYLRDHYANNYTSEICATLNRSERSLYGKAMELGLKKDKSFYNQNIQPLLNSGKSHRYKSGNIPHNKGVPMPEKTREAVSRTWFKSGSLPHNTRHDGALSFRKGYWYVRVEKNVWKHYHKHIWEQAHGPVNHRTHMVKFKDGNPNNCQLDNLYLCSRADNMRANTIHRYPTQIKEAIKAHTALSKKIAQYEK